MYVGMLLNIIMCIAFKVRCERDIIVPLSSSICVHTNAKRF